MPTLIINDKLGNEIESHDFCGAFSSWINENVPAYDDSKKLFTCTLNGVEWSNYDDQLLADDLIIATMEPQEPTTLFIIALAASLAMTAYTLSNLPNTEYQKTSESGQSIYSPNAGTNSAVPNGYIREIAGSPNWYPDLICQGRRRYEGQNEYLYLFLCVGRGYFDLDISNLYVSETSAITYASDLTPQFFEPGDDVSGNIASQNWHTSDEISGITLESEPEEKFGNWTVDAFGDTMTFYLDGVASPAPLANNERVEISTASNSGFYQVTGISGVDGEIVSFNVLEYDDGWDETDPASFTTSYGEEIEMEGISGGVRYYGSYVATPENELADKAEVDVNFPNGLTEIDGNNQNTNRTVSIRIEWREYGESKWNSIVKTYTAATRDEYVDTVEIDFGSSIRPEFRFRRVTDDAQSNTIIDEVQIARLKARLESPTSYDGVTTIALRLRGGSDLSSSSENKINIRGASRKLPTLQEIQDAANGTPFDLSKENTTIPNWLIQDLKFVGSYNFDQYLPESTVVNFDFSFGNDGLELIVMDGEYIKFFTLANAYDLRERTYKGYINTSNYGICLSVQYIDSGKKIGTAFRDGSEYLRVIRLSSAYEPNMGSISTPQLVNDNSTPYYSQNGYKVWISNSTTNLYEHEFTTAYSPTTMQPSSASAGLSLQEDIASFAFNDDGTKLFVCDSDSNVYTFYLGTGFDLYTISSELSRLEDTYMRDISVTIGNVFYSSISLYGRSIVWGSIPQDLDGRASRSMCRFAANALYEAMGPDVNDFVDFDALSDLDDLLEERGDHLDAEFVDETTLWEAIKAMMITGYCEPTIKNGKLTPVREQSTDSYGHLYTPDIMLDEGLQIDHSHYEATEPDGVEVEYFSSLTNSMEVVQCLIDGDLGSRPKRIQAIGINDETRAWRFGMRERLRLHLKPASYTITTELDALNSEYGDIASLASELFVSQCGEVVSVDGSNVTLDFEPEFGEDSNYAAFRTREGLTSLYVVVQGPSSNVITLLSPSTLDFTPVSDGSMDSTFVSFGSAEEWGVRGIIRTISPQGDNLVELTAVEYLPEIYANDNREPD